MTVDFGRESSKPEGSDPHPALTPDEERAVHRAACEILAAAIDRRPPSLPEAWAEAGACLSGAFVSVKRRGRLRACCGVLGRGLALGEAVARAARQTATEDARLPPISPTELPYLDVEVWLLHSPRSVLGQGEARAAEVVIGTHGLQVRRGPSNGLLLPSVALDSEVDARGFLEMVCEKAGLPPSAWKEGGTELQTFEGHAIAGAFAWSLAEPAGTATPPLLTFEDLDQLAAHCRRTMRALAEGYLASCYSTHCVDATVQGLSMGVTLPGGRDLPPFFKMSFRPGVSLQSTLYAFAQATVRSLAPHRLGAADWDTLKVAITALWDPAMHGTLEAPDLEGCTSDRAILVSEGQRLAWVYDPGRSTQELITEAAYQARVRRPAVATVLSFAAASTERSASASYAPRPQEGERIRPPAVVETFYPGHIDELKTLVKELVGQPGHAPEPWPAVMVPHAALKYSGKLAARVFARVRIPDTVIIVGPRHRPVGMDWTVAPHERWAIPGWTTPSDQELARELAENIPDLHLDAAPHRQEHCIEVQLPLLAQLAPQARVVGILVGAGELEQCCELAAGLARVLRDWQPRPLLVISNDMNHYASDAETRRLDAIALEALETLDPVHLYHTARTHKISMCGLLPTVVVLETLRRLGSLQRCERVGYATSADVTGDTSRVVGYAGMVFG